MKDYSEIIKTKYTEAEAAYGKDPSKDTTAKTPESFFKSPLYRSVILLMGKAIKKFESGTNKDYYKHVYITQGDYSKRKGYEGSIYDSMKEQAEYIQEYVKSHGFAKYTILGIYSDLWDILTDSKWRIAFKKAFDYPVDEKNRSIVDGFRLSYVALVLAFESIAVKIVDFKYALYSGIADVDAINSIQNDNASMMKNMVIPSIELITLCKNTSTPLHIVEDMIAEEEKGKKSTESYDPTTSTEGVFSETIGKLMSKIVIPGISKGVSKISGLASKHPKLAIPIAAIAAAILFTILAFNASRMILYYVGIHKIDLEKRLEIESELIANNVNELKLKAEKASTKEERDRWNNIIAKQLEIKNNIDTKLGKRFDDDDLKAGIVVDTEMDKDMEATDNEVKNSQQTLFDLEI